MNNTDNRPLWERLNEERSGGKWYEYQGMLKSVWETNGERDGAYISEMKFGNHSTHIANAEYTALAVNNMAALAEALENHIKKGHEAFNDYAKGKEVDFKSICGAMIETAQQALNNIS